MSPRVVDELAAAAVVTTSGGGGASEPRDGVGGLRLRVRDETGEGCELESCPFASTDAVSLRGTGVHEHTRLKRKSAVDQLSSPTDLSHRPPNERLSQFAARGLRSSVLLVRVGSKEIVIMPSSLRCCCLRLSNNRRRGDTC